MTHSSDEQQNGLAATGRMADQVRAFDWAATSLGPLALWPERLRGVIDMVLAAPQMATLAIGRDRIFLFNDHAASHYGEGHAALLGRPLAQAFPHEFECVAGFYDRAFAGESLHVPAQPLDPAQTGTPEVFDAYLTPVRAATGEVLAVHMTGFAIGTRLRLDASRRAEEERYRTGLEKRIDVAAAEIRASHDLLRGTIDSSHDMIQVFEAVRDEGGRIVDFRWLLNNRTSEEQFGDVIGGSLIARNPGVVVEGIFDTFKRVVETGVSEQAERHYAHEQFDGWFLQSVAKLGDGVATTTKDIGSWKAAQAEILRLQEIAAEARLDESEERYRTLFNSIDQGFCVIEMIFDPSGRPVDYRVLEANAALAAQTGLTDIVGRRMRDIAPTHEQHWYDIYGRIATSGQAERFEQRAVALGRWFDVYALPIGKPDQHRVAVVFGDITERRRQDAALRDSQQRFQALATAGKNSIYRMSPDWRIMYALDSDTLAVTADPIVDWVDKYILPEDRPGVFASIAEAIRTKSLFEREHRVLMADGSIGWVHSRAVPLLGDDGEIVEWFGAGANVTEHREAVERLRESEERLRQFGEASRDVLWIRDAATLQWIYLTPGFETIYGVSRDAALAGDSYGNWLDLILPADREQALASIARVRAGEHVTFEFRIRRPSDGTIRWLRNTDFPILDDRGEVRMIGGIGHDLTDARETELRFRTLVEGMPQMVWRAVDGGEWTWASPQWIDATGQDEAHYRDWGWLDVLHPDDRKAACDAWSHALESGGFQVEHRICVGNPGMFRWFQTRAKPVRDPSGAVVEWLGTSTDVNELHQLQDRQSLLLAELQHRVRNILTVVRSVFARTVDAGGDLETLSDHFKGRLDSLARAQVVVTQSATGLVDLELLVRDELLSVGASDGPNLRIEGPDVALPPKAAESIGLAIHELTTNALKYGALKSPTARLEICWATNIHHGGERRLDLTWTEQGVPAISLNPRSGFGSELINEALPYRLGAETSLIIRGGGVRCTLSVPLSDEDAVTFPQVEA